MKLHELVAVLGHELRTPLAAILGYQELLADGIYGDVHDRQREPLDRIQHSASQLLHLIDGLQELVEHSVASDADEVVSASSQELLHQILESAKPYAAGRQVVLEAASADDQQLAGVRLQRFLRATDLALVAAIKVSHGAVLRVGITGQNDHVVFSVLGSELTLEDQPHASTDPRPLTATRLRLSMAQAAAQIAGGELRLAPEGDAILLTLRLPLLQAD